ncbi:hypothetical protein [Mycolicibacterium parafortuitum]|uniref:Secreted protein n=1 Tax=Mycolicibacterium parafortuitum TaxID=39692 RepID=A0A375YKY3_MYCPF|nr:hypothetical protein [Mycolicibacterium parafortuitum]ORB27709.1 hypothetical protein BST38_23285 [Mycolicibacterium parafortuitum]SRX81699.1 hypothetical protein MPP7335_03455 [Mycolicibacterium parafortuitum]
MDDTTTRTRRGTMQIPRSRGAVSGLLIVALGVWGALVPFVGPFFDFAFSPDRPWAWTTGRGWLQVLPGLVAIVGGLLLFVSRNRATAMLGSWMALAAGAWFVVGRAVAGPLGLGSAGEPVAATEAQRVWLELTYFSGLGALIIFLAALAAGRLSVRTARDIAYREAHRDPQAVADPAPVATDARPWENSDAVTEPVRRRRPSLFGRRRRETHNTLPV